MHTHDRLSGATSRAVVCAFSLLALYLAACGDDASPTDGGATDGGPGGDDAGTPAGDAGTPAGDAGLPPMVGPDLPIPDPIAVFYISSSVGDDDWSGALAEPNGDGSDGPKATLDAMLSLLNASAPGTHVLMRRGDEWSTSMSLEIGGAEGTATDPVILSAYGEGSQPHIIAQAAIQTIVVRGNRAGSSRYFRIDDLRLTAASPADGQIAIYTGESFHPEGPHHLTFSKLTIEDNGGGMTMYGHDHLVHGSRIANNRLGMGIYVSGENVSFQYNEFENNGLPPPDVFVHSLYISACDGVLFEHNIVHSATDGVKVRRSHNGVYRHNTFYGMFNMGIHLGGDSEGGSRNNRIESNLFYDNATDIVIKSESGTQVELLDGLVIANNMMRPVSGRAEGYDGHITITDLPAANVSIVNNLVYETGDETGIRVMNDGSNIECRNNVIGQFGSGGTYSLSASVAESNNLDFASMGAFDALNLTDPAGGDFEPTAASTMLIDQGADVSAVLGEDYAGVARPQGAAFDIGPYEFSP